MQRFDTILQKRAVRLARRSAKVCYSLVGVGMGLVTAFYVLLQPGVALHEWVAYVGFLLTLFAPVYAVLIAVGLRLSRAKLPVNGELDESERCLTIGGTRIAAADVDALVVCDAVHLYSKGVSYEFQDLNQSQRESIERALAPPTHYFETGPAARAGAWWSVWVASANILFGAIWAGSSFYYATPLAIFASLSLASASVLLFRHDMSLHIGLDGVRIGREFVPYASLRPFKAAKGRLVLVRTDGRQIRGSIRVDDAFLRALDAQVRRRIEADPRDGEAFELQENETPKAWLQRVRSRFTAKTFRDAVVPVEAAKALLSDAQTSFRVRVGVAVALAPFDAEFVNDTLDQLAHPKGEELREALELPADAQEVRVEKLVRS